MTTQPGHAETSSEIYLSTVDLYGLLTGAGFRVDIGRETHSAEGQRASTGTESLPKGRYAVFEFKSAPERVIDVLYGVYHLWLPESGESVRAQPHYLSFANDGSRDIAFKLHVPLEEVATLSRDESMTPLVASTTPEAAHS
jgi:hypothetical protein